MKKYIYIDHTADIGVRAFGKTLEESFENIAKAMFDIITDNSEIDLMGQYNILLESSDYEQLLVDWLSELLYLNSSLNLIFGFFKVSFKGKKSILEAKIFGEKFDISKHKIGSEIKAVTYHMLKVKNKKPYHVQVLFDV
jgi:SHS2 domain-containing protein